MTEEYLNVYLKDTATVVGPYEKKGPLGSLFDKSYKDFYFNTKSFEDGDGNFLYESVMFLLKKMNKKAIDMDLFISGDLLNQITSSSYTASKLGIPYLGIYSACATSVEGMIIASNLIEAKKINNCICSVSSNNNAAEKQFRYPVKYGGPKPKTTTFTVTGGASACLTNEKTNIKVVSSTIGKVIDMGITDVYHMGAVMAPSCADAIYNHLKNTKTNVGDYDLILSGDLGIYGKDILKEYMKTEYNIDLNNYDDSACMIYDINKQPVYAGGSGPACLPLVFYSYVLPRMKEGKLKKVLLVATGSLHSTTMVNLKHSIPSISHAICLEVIK